MPVRSPEIEIVLDIGGIDIFAERFNIHSGQYPSSRFSEFPYGFRLRCAVITPVVSPGRPNSNKTGARSALGQQWYGKMNLGKVILICFRRFETDFGVKEITVDSDSDPLVAGEIFTVIDADLNIVKIGIKPAI